MNPSLRTQRLRLTWLLAIPFLALAQPTPAYLIAGVLLSVPGLLLRGSAAGHIDKDRILAVSGPFAHLRHPLYVGSFILGIGLVVGGGLWFLLPLFVGIFSWIYARAIKAEEEGLLARFGLNFAEYRSAVPAFIPRLRPAIPHRWRASTEPKARGGHPGTNGIGSATTGASTEGGFQLHRFLQNREWEAWLGMLLGFGLLAVKMIWAP